MPEQAAPVRIGQLHLAEARAVDARDAVVLGQPLVHERVVGAQQLERAAVLAHDVAEEQLGLAAERLPDVVVEIREQQQVGRDLRLQVAQLQPLTGEIVDQGIGAFVRDHAAHLRGQHARLAQSAGRGQIQQRLVRDAAPEEERQARGELQVADWLCRTRPGAGRIAFDSIQERRARQNARDAGADAGVEVAAVLPRCL